jgi:hypothetical protein
MAMMTGVTAIDLRFYLDLDTILREADLSRPHWDHDGPGISSPFCFDTATSIHMADSEGMAPLVVEVKIQRHEHGERCHELLADCFLRVLKRGQLYATCEFDEEGVVSVMIDVSERNEFELTPIYTLELETPGFITTSPFKLAEVLRVFDQLATSPVPVDMVDRHLVAYARTLRAELNGEEPS